MKECSHFYSGSAFRHSPLSSQMLLTRDFDGSFISFLWERQLYWFRKFYKSLTSCSIKSRLDHAWGGGVQTPEFSIRCLLLLKTKIYMVNGGGPP